MKPHKLAELFPMMTAQEYEGLLQDISENGQLVSIIEHEGFVLDGRNRMKACIELGLKPVIEAYSGSDPLGFVISTNLHRRHLNSSQRACLALDCVEVFRAQAKQAQIEGGRNKVRQKIAYALDDKKSSQRASKLFRTNRTYVQLAKKLNEQSPKLFDDVKSGKVSVFQAWKEFNHREIEPVKLEGKFAVIYADPPWKYHNPFCSNYDS